MSHDVFIVDDKHPEDMAMLQALYSRSPASVLTHLEKLEQSGSGKFMDQFYVGYGHSSIGDCGTTTCFIEQVSMLAAKAIQDNPLYNGQEASTRYLDFSQQAIIDPYDNPASRAIQDKWMVIYNAALESLIEGIKKAYPFNAAEYKSEKIWENTLKARAFDSARSLLPMGTTTLLSWTSSLRQVRDNLRRLKHHPLPEIQAVAQSVFAKIYERYPHSFQGTEMDDVSTPRDDYDSAFTEKNHFVSHESLTKRFAISGDEASDLHDGGIIVRREAVDLAGIAAQEEDVLAARPSMAHLPWRLESYGKYNLMFLLDFGSFRDIQRHRNGVCQIPLIDATYGMHPWYLEQFEKFLDAAVFEKLKSDIQEQIDAVHNLDELGIETSATLNQYLYPMGLMGLVHVSYSVREMLYVGELRSGKTVHPSLRPIAQKILGIIKEDLPMAAVHGDLDEDSWTAKRGEQTISAKT